MSDVTDTERRYTDQEVALILRRAVNQQRAGAVRADGLSLAQLRDIAREIGVDPDLVDEAAGELPAVQPGPVARFFGGPTVHDIRLDFETTPSSEKLQELVMAIRTALRHQGRTQEIMGSLEWQSVGEPSQVAVTVTPHAGRTDVHILVDRGAAATLVGFGSLGLGAVLAAISGAVLEPGIAGGVGLMGGGLAGGVLLARVIWMRNTRRFRDKLARLTESIRRAFLA